jgi:hypothetical protein
VRIVRLLALAVVACGGAEPAPIAPACPAGSTWNGTDCAAIVDTSCPPGMHFVSARGCVASVAPAPPPAPPPPPPEVDTTPHVERTVWIQRMIAQLPPRICAVAYFQQCFVATNAECQTAVTALTRSCLNDHEKRMPRFFDSESGSEEGKKIGECVGAAYEAQMRGSGHFVDNAACNDPSRW